MAKKNKSYKHFKSLGFRRYADYLKSDLWRSIRQRVLDRDGHKCRACGKPARLVHHLDYNLDTMAGENIKGLFAACRECHDEFHLNGANMVPLSKATRRTIRAIERFSGQPLYGRRKCPTCDNNARENDEYCTPCIKDQGRKPVPTAQQLKRRKDVLQSLLAKPRF